MTTREQIENIVKGVRATIEEFEIDCGAKPNCLIFGKALAAEVAKLMGKIGAEAAKEWTSDSAEFGQKLFLGLPVTVFKPGRDCAAALFYPLGLFVRPRQQVARPSRSAMPRTGGGKRKRRR